MSNVLNKRFFKRSTLIVAQKLLGKYLCHRYKSRTIAAVITDVEAYDGPRDKASHAARGKTPRNAVMFGPAGHWYVYFTYGMHWMLNIVTGKNGYPAAILIRGVASASRRISGPARVTKFFKIGKSMNAKLANRRSGLWIEDRGVRVQKSQIKRAARIGVEYAGPVWTKKKYRFYIEEKQKPRLVSGVGVSNIP